MFGRPALALCGVIPLLACEQGAELVPNPSYHAPPTSSALATASVAPVSVPISVPISVPAERRAPLEPKEPPSQCQEQAPQQFLVEAHFDSFFAAGGQRGDWQQVLRRAVRYRTEQYGYVKGYGKKAWNASTPAAQAQVVTFFGLSVALHRRIAPALACVETAIRAHCTSEPYQPYVLSGLRKHNTYFGGEISNHLYGIALDIDPLRNPCCGCIGPWGASDRCNNEKNKFERMEMPRCWVTQFERFGFYWLGHDKIEDTMHFEFLADPSQILRPADSVR